MKRIKIDIDDPAKKDLEVIAEYFRQGKIVAYPTDTVYGLGCIATDKKAIDKIFRIKKRDRSKPLLVLVKSWCMLKKYFFVPGKAERHLRNIWPGPVTALLRKRAVLPNELALGKDKLGVRLPKVDFLIKMINKVGAPIVSTSLNIAGDPPLTDVNDVDGYLKPRPDLIIDIGKKLKGRPSRLIDINKEGEVIILRK